jgi:hypothetical protein
MKFPGLDELLDLDPDVWDWTLMSRQNQNFLDCRDLLFESVKIKTLDQDTMETNQGLHP